MEETELLSSVSNALRILQNFTVDEPQKGVREIASDLDIPKSTVHRILKTLKHYHFVSKNELTQKYELGLSVLELNTTFLNGKEFYSHIYPFMKKFVDTYHENAHLVTLEGTNIVYVHKVENEQHDFVPTYNGLHNFAHCTSSGKLLLAYSTTYKVEQVIQDGLFKFTETTITDPDEFRAELSKIHERGYAISNGEYRSNTCTISVPIKNYFGTVIAAMNMTVPTSRFQPKRVKTYTAALLECAAEISDQIGFEVD